jgi:anaerobic dimethyl sulfoxide reductase subunit A
VVLPVTTFLERNDIINGGGNFVLFSNKVYEPIPEVKNDYDIFCLLAERMGFGDKYSEVKTEEDWLRDFVKASEIPDYEDFRQIGIYMGENQKRVAFKEFIENPEKYRLSTPSGLIQLSSESFARTGASPYPINRPIEHNDAYPLKMITPKSRYRTNSTNYNIEWFSEREEQRLMMHPEDAEARSIRDRETVLVTSPQGAVLVPVSLTMDIMKGVVCLLEGAWAKFNEAEVEVNGSVNVLTSTVPTLPSHGSRTHSVNVQVEKR